MPDLTTARGTSPSRVGVLSVLAAATCLLARPSLATCGVAVCILAVAQAARIDAATHRIPNRLLGMAAVALSMAALLSGGRALSASAAVGLTWLVVLFGLHLADPSLGFGDVKLGGVLGTMLGLAGHAAGWSIVTSMLASSTAFLAGAGITLAAARQRSRGAPTPFAPGLVLGATATAVALALIAAIS